MFRIKPHTHQRCSEGSNKTLCAQGPRDPRETESHLPLIVCLLWRQESAVACHRGRDSGCSRSVSHSLCAKPSWRRLPLTPPQSCRADDPQTAEQLYQINSALLRKFQDPQQISQPGDSAKGLRTSREFDFGGQWDLIAELTQDRENRLLESTNKTLCTPGPGERSSEPTRDRPDLPVSAQESPAEARVRATESCRACTGPFEGGRQPLSSLPLPQFGLRSSNRTGTQPAHQQKIELKIY